MVSGHDGRHGQDRGPLTTCTGRGLGLTVPRCGSSMPARSGRHPGSRRTDIVRLITPDGEQPGWLCTTTPPFGMMKGHNAQGRASPVTWRRAVPKEVTMHQPPIPHVEGEDPEIAELIHAEARRQFEKIRLIPSENYVSTAVLEASGSVLT